MDDAFRRRLRWRARRGLLENDLILSRFFERNGALDAADVSALDTLLDLPDNELLDLLLERKEPDARLDRPDIQSLLARLRAA
jgi:antitoxin CptB